jgi:hypothetical protein
MSDAARAGRAVRLGPQSPPPRELILNPHRLGLAASIACLLALVLAEPGAARTLRGPSGFSATAPNGYKLKEKSGLYTVSGGAGRVVYGRFKSSSTPAKAGAALLNQLGLARTAVSATRTRFQADLQSSAAVERRHVEVRRDGRGILAATMSIGRGSLTALNGIARSARGGKLLNLRRARVTERSAPYPIAPIPSNPWVNMQVPNGFNSAPSDSGAVFLANRPGQPEGVAAFGVAALIVDPNQYYGCFIGPQFCGERCDTVYPYVGSAAALVNVLPRELGNQQCRAGVPAGQVKFATNVAIAQQLAAQPLGPGYDSAGWWAHYTFDGKRWSGVFLVGTAYFGSDSPYWLLYYTFIAVPDTPGTRTRGAGAHAAQEDRSFQQQLIRDNLAQSLMQSWRSWRINPSVQNARFQTIKMSIDQTTASIREAHEFRIQTYSKVNDAWDLYIRQAPGFPDPAAE